MSKNVRANVLLSGFIFAPAGEGKSTLTRIIHVDPAGNIPSSVRPHSQLAVAAIPAFTLRVRLVLILTLRFFVQVVNVTAKATHEVISSFNKLLQ